MRERRKSRQRRSEPRKALIINLSSVVSLEIKEQRVGGWTDELTSCASIYDTRCKRRLPSECCVRHERLRVLHSLLAAPPLFERLIFNRSSNTFTHYCLPVSTCEPTYLIANMATTTSVCPPICLHMATCLTIYMPTFCYLSNGLLAYSLPIYMYLPAYDCLCVRLTSGFLPICLTLIT